jgi:hypothetical protein
VSVARPSGQPTLASIGGNTSWANADDRSARTAPAREAFRDRFIREAREKYGYLPESELFDLRAARLFATTSLWWADR